MLEEIWEGNLTLVMMRRRRIGNQFLKTNQNTFLLNKNQSEIRHNSLNNSSTWMTIIQHSEIILIKKKLKQVLVSFLKTAAQ